MRTEFSKIDLGGDMEPKLSIKEADIEELVRQNAELLSAAMGEDTSILIIGQQNTNLAGGRSDLVAIDGYGNLVLIELKRDAKDEQRRAEPMELQAIRYAASFSTIKTKAEIIDLLFSSYVEAHRKEFEIADRPGLSNSQLAEEHLNRFLIANRISDHEINQAQRVILLASGFEDQTLSACAWLAKNNVDIYCMEIYPVKYSDKYLIAVEQKIPPPKLDDYLVGIATKKAVSSRTPSSSKTGRVALPKMPALFDWGLVKPGDQVYITKFPEQTAVVTDFNGVNYQGQPMSFNNWAKKITGWSAVNIYEWIMLAKEQKTLDQLRRERLEHETKEDIVTEDTSSLEPASHSGPSQP